MHVRTTNILIGVSLSEPHVNGTELHERESSIMQDRRLVKKSISDSMQDQRLTRREIRIARTTALYHASVGQLNTM